MTSTAKGLLVSIIQNFLLCRVINPTPKHIREKVERLSQCGKAIGMKSNVKKTKAVRYNATNQTPVTIDGKVLKTWTVLCI